MDPDGRADLSNFSTIVGLALALFVALFMVALVRRILVQRQMRTMEAQIRLRRIAFRSRFGVWDSDEYGPRPIALGARARLLRRPLLWEDYILPLHNPKSVRGEQWNEIQPTSVQLTTPHTTAQFPTRILDTSPNADSNATNEIRGDSNVTPPLLSTPSTNISSPNQSSDCIPESKPSTLYPHPIHLTFLISMPNSLSPTYNPGSTQSYRIHPSFSQPPMSTTTTVGEQPTPLILEFGTQLSPVLLPSLSISQAELDSYWNLPNISCRSSERSLVRMEHPRPDPPARAEMLGYPFHLLP